MRCKFTISYRDHHIIKSFLVTRLVASTKQSGLMYLRTDVGGAYRWNSATDTWTPITDWLNNWNENGVESIALDPNNANLVYLAVGNYGYNSTILISSNQGQSFTSVDVSSKFNIYGNAGGRGNGERLQVDPNLGSILFYGSDRNGLWKSKGWGGGKPFRSLFGIGITPNDCNGLLSEFFRFFLTHQHKCRSSIVHG